VGTQPSSTSDRSPPRRRPGLVGLRGTKGAVDVISRVLAQELARRKIRVNTLSPGAIVTEGVKAMDAPGFEELAISRTPLGRVGTADDIAKAALFLATDESGWITGEELLVGGIRL
jgi:3-oxoacyl-[acyl-carrier protein] reductase